MEQYPIVSNTVYDNFLVMAQDVHDYSIEAFCLDSEEYGKMLCIAATEEAIYITREQAKAFFGLVEPFKK